MLKKYFFTGLLIWIPILITISIVKFIFNFLSGAINFIPERYLPAWLSVPGVELIVALLIVFITGMLTRNFIGNKLVKWLEHFFEKIPMVRTIYSNSKKILETIVSAKGDAFRKVLLIEYPRKGVWTIAFQTAAEHHDLNEYFKKKMITVFVPTTPNPTAGFILFVPQTEVVELLMPVETALKFVISFGTIGRDGLKLA